MYFWIKPWFEAAHNQLTSSLKCDLCVCGDCRKVINSSTWGERLFLCYLAYKYLAWRTVDVNKHWTHVIKIVFVLLYEQINKQWRLLWVLNRQKCIKENSTRQGLQSPPCTFFIVKMLINDNKLIGFWCVFYDAGDLPNGRNDKRAIKRVDFLFMYLIDV